MDNDKQKEPKKKKSFFSSKEEESSTSATLKWGIKSVLNPKAAKRDLILNAAGRIAKDALKARKEKNKEESKRKEPPKKK